MRTSSRSCGSASQRAYDFTKWAILNAVYEGGEVITEGGLANELGLSRTPVRAALLRLEADGLVRLSPNRGAIVSSFSVTEAEEVLEARALVERSTVGRSFANRAVLLPGLEAVHQEMGLSGCELDTARFTDCDRRFHALIVAAAGNSVLSSIYRTLRERQALFTSVRMRGRADRMGAAIVEHDKILVALRGDDEAAFATAVDDHLRWSIALARESR